MQGILFAVPVILTIYILVQTFLFVDGLLFGILPIKIPGLGILFIVFFLTLLGFVGRTFFFRPITSFINATIEKAPLVKFIYFSIKDLLSAFVGKQKKFDKPVLVKISKIYDVEKIGFITQTDLSQIGINDKKIAVYFPHSYAFSGELFIISADSITPLNLTSTEAMKFIISGGISKT